MQNRNIFKLERLQLTRQFSYLYRIIHHAAVHTQFIRPPLCGASVRLFFGVLYQRIWQVDVELRRRRRITDYWEGNRDRNRRIRGKGRIGRMKD